MQQKTQEQLRKELEEKLRQQGGQYNLSEVAMPGVNTKITTDK